MRTIDEWLRDGYLQSLLVTEYLSSGIFDLLTFVYCVTL